MTRSALLPAAALLLALLPSCGKGPSEGPARKEVILYCGAGLRKPAEKLMAFLERRFPVKIRADYAGSEVLLSRIRLHRKGDLFLPGDARYVDQAADDGLVLARRSLHRWRLAILVPKDNPAGIRRAEDLLSPKVRLGLGDPKACAVGKAARRLFRNLGIPWERVKKRVAFLSLTVNELGLQIQARSLDAVVVWDATARQFARYGRILPIEGEAAVTSTVDLAVLSCADDAGLARRLLEAAASPAGRAAFADF